MKAYHGHEREYARMRREGVQSWDQRDRPHPMDPDDLRFLEDVLRQLWCPRGGKALEMGCGTAPLLRFLCGAGFEGVGVDVSETAVEMAREQSAGLPVSFETGDVCRGAISAHAPLDLCLDGHCLHCVCDPADRRRVLADTATALSVDGVFVLMTMCAPVNDAGLARMSPGQIFRDSILYAPVSDPGDFEDVRRMGERLYLPVRCIPPWQSILAALEEAGLEPRLLRLALPTEQDPVSSLNIAASRRG